MAAMRLGIIALALGIAGCGSDDGSSVDLGRDLSVPIHDLAIPRHDLVQCPPHGSACSMPDAICNGFEIYCHCGVASHTWYCCDASGTRSCPQTPPSGPDCCLDYAPSQCSFACNGGVTTVCSCTDDAWHCTTMPCD